MTEEELIEHLVGNNGEHYNIYKAKEELEELSLVLSQYMNKKGGPKEPSKQEIIDEIGDVLIRVAVLAKIFGEEEVMTRVDFKLDKYRCYIEENRYSKI